MPRKHFCTRETILQFTPVVRRNFRRKKPSTAHKNVTYTVALSMKRFFKSDFLKTQLPYTYYQVGNERLAYFWHGIILNFLIWPKIIFIHFSLKIVGRWDDVCGFSLFKTFTLYTQTLICVFFIIFYTFPKVLTRRIRLTINIFFLSRWLIP